MVAGVRRSDATAGPSPPRKKEVSSAPMRRTGQAPTRERVDRTCSQEGRAATPRQITGSRSTGSTSPGRSGIRKVSEKNAKLDVAANVNMWCSFRLRC